jgi:signal recognition particle subunit SRP54
VSATESPIIFIGTGEHFDDLEEFEANSFIRRLLGMGDLSKLITTVTSVVDKDDTQKLMDTMKTGNFPLRAMQTQF